MGEVIPIEPKWITRYNSKPRFRWDMFIILLAIFNSFIIPYDIAFGP